MHTSPIPSFKSMIHHFNFVPSEKYVKKRCQTNFVSKEKLIEIILANLQTNFQKQNIEYFSILEKFNDNFFQFFWVFEAFLHNLINQLSFDSVLTQF